ncbi:hypothetical protein VPH35_087792 [Triticum aestivum]|nr:cyanidin 3-O-rutinoside 5-O-glucosyltransferase-like [Triticum aestivum]
MVMAKEICQGRYRNNYGDGHIHFLVAVYSMQGHLNPARCLARRLAGIGGATVTLSMPIFGHRRTLASDEEVNDGAISYIPFSDGKDDGSWAKDWEERTWRRRASAESLSAVVGRLAAEGRPVTCMVSTLNMPPAIDVAREHRIPFAVFWVQPATTLATYYHYFHGHAEMINSRAADTACVVSLPGLHPLSIREMPSLIIDKDEASKMYLRGFGELFEQIEQDKAMVLVNTCDALELEATSLKALQSHLDVIAVGPTVPPAGAGEEAIHLFRRDEKKYMEWLDSQPAKSVVYVSFGSLGTYSQRQAEEILRGLRCCARAYLWVVRREGRMEEVERLIMGTGAEDDESTGMVVEWCDQLRVLAHPSVACFVTHCGWNSTLEAVASGVPPVAVPGWSDQSLNAHLVEEWGVGVRAERDAEGLLPGVELARCVELVMGDGGTAAKVKTNAAAYQEKARQAMAADGPSERNLGSFVNRVRHLVAAVEKNHA